MIRNRFHDTIGAARQKKHVPRPNTRRDVEAARLSRVVRAEPTNNRDSLLKMFKELFEMPATVR